MGEIARRVGVELSDDARVLSEFAAVVSTLAEEILAPKPMVIRWHVELTHEVTLVVLYSVPGLEEPVRGNVTWTLLGILNDGAAIATRLVYAVAAAMDRQQAPRDELPERAGG